MKIQINTNDSWQVEKLSRFTNLQGTAQSEITAKMENLVDDATLVFDLTKGTINNVNIVITLTGMVGAHDWAECSIETNFIELCQAVTEVCNPLTSKLQNLADLVEEWFAEPIKPVAKTKWCLCHNCQKGVGPCSNLF